MKLDPFAVFVTVAIAVILSCSIMHNEFKGQVQLTQQQREVNVNDEMSPFVRQSYVNGVIVKGMTKKMVFEMYGQPDEVEQTSKMDDTWVYKDHKRTAISWVVLHGDVVKLVTGEPKFTKKK